jgi:hypothetical protein
MNQNRWGCMYLPGEDRSEILLLLASIAITPCVSVMEHNLFDGCLWVLFSK